MIDAICAPQSRASKKLAVKVRQSELNSQQIPTPSFVNDDVDLVTTFQPFRDFRFNSTWPQFENGCRKGREPNAERLETESWPSSQQVVLHNWVQMFQTQSWPTWSAFERIDRSFWPRDQQLLRVKSKPKSTKRMSWPWTETMEFIELVFPCQFKCHYLWVVLDHNNLALSDGCRGRNRMTMRIHDLCPFKNAMPVQNLGNGHACCSNEFHTMPKVT